MQETANKQKRMTLKSVHEMLDGMSVELAEKVHLLFMGKKILKAIWSFCSYDFVAQRGHTSRWSMIHSNNIEE